MEENLKAEKYKLLNSEVNSDKQAQEETKVLRNKLIGELKEDIY